MMKTLCVAVVVLSLFSVCQPASLACEKLISPVDKGPDLIGRWYLIAMSTEVCLVTSLVNAVLGPSIVVDVTAVDVKNIYEGHHKVKMYGHCVNESEPFWYESNTLFDVNSTNSPTGEPDVLLQSGCPDCFVLKGNDVIKNLMLYSKRPTVTAAELKEFETQSQCLGWSKPEVLNTDHDYENCKSLEDGIADDDQAELLTTMYERVISMRHHVTKCFTESLLTYLPSYFSQNLPSFKNMRAAL